MTVEIDVFEGGTVVRWELNAASECHLPRFECRLQGGIGQCRRRRCCRRITLRRCCCGYVKNLRQSGGKREVEFCVAAKNYWRRRSTGCREDTVRIILFPSNNMFANACHSKVCLDRTVRCVLECCDTLVYVVCCLKRNKFSNKNLN